MPRKPTGKPSARPNKPIDWDLVDKLLEAGCLGTEIAANFDMHPNTFYDRCQLEKKMGFTEYQAQKRGKGDSILRAVQFQTAVKDKDRSMLIWLGKQRLGQKEPEKEKAGITPEELINALGGFGKYVSETTPDGNHHKEEQPKTSKDNPKRSS